MKKIIGSLIVLCTIGATSMRAQTEKGNFLVGISTHTNLGIMNLLESSSPNIMSLSFSSIKYKSDSDEEDADESTTKLTSINMAPRFGYFLVKNLAIGADFQLGYMKIKDHDDEYDTDSQINSTLFAAGPFIRYYIPAGKVYPFLEAGAVFGSQSDKYDYGDGDESTSKTAVNSYGGGAGIAIPIGNKVTFDTMLGYSSTSFKDKEDNPDNGKTIIGGFDIKFGFQIYL
jgi:hypothetical protein